MMQVCTLEVSGVVSEMAGAAPIEHVNWAVWGVFIEVLFSLYALKGWMFRSLVLQKLNTNTEVKLALRYPHASC